MPGVKKSARLRDLRVGLFVVGAIGVLIFLILNASGDISPFSKKLKLRAQFAKGYGPALGSGASGGLRIARLTRWRCRRRTRRQASHHVHRQRDSRQARRRPDPH